MIDMLGWLLICFWILMLFRMEWNHRIDKRALDIIHDQNRKWIEANIKTMPEAQFYPHFASLLARYETVDGYKWKHLFDLTRWTLKQAYPQIVQWGKEGEHGE